MGKSEIEVHVPDFASSIFLFLATGNAEPRWGTRWDGQMAHQSTSKGVFSGENVYGNNSICDRI